MSIDNQSEAERYREEMFTLAGEGDPTVRMAETPARVREILEFAGGDMRTRPAPDEWSVVELLGHLVDAELVVGVRLRRTLYETDVALDAYDQDLWVRAAGYAESDPALLLMALAALRPLTITTWEHASGAQRRHVAQHSERGLESAETIYRMLAGHDRFHLDQMRATLEQVRGGPS